MVVVLVRLALNILRRQLKDTAFSVVENWQLKDWLNVTPCLTVIILIQYQRGYLKTSAKGGSVSGGQMLKLKTIKNFNKIAGLKKFQL